MVFEVQGSKGDPNSAKLKSRFPREITWFRRNCILPNGGLIQLSCIESFPTEKSLFKPCWIKSFPMERSLFSQPRLNRSCPNDWKLIFFWKSWFCLGKRGLNISLPNGKLSVQAKLNRKLSQGKALYSARLNGRFTYRSPYLARLTITSIQTGLYSKYPLDWKYPQYSPVK